MTTYPVDVDFLLQSGLYGGNGTPGKTRTCGSLVRTEVLCSSELQACSIVSLYHKPLYPSELRIYRWWTQRVTIPRPAGCRPAALPTELCVHDFAYLTLPHCVWRTELWMILAGQAV